MARNRTGNYPVSGKPCDVEYRTNRLTVLADKARMALESIDPAAVSEGSVARGLELVAELSDVIKQIAGTKPAKRSYSKGGKQKPEATEETPKKKAKKPAKVKNISQEIEAVDDTMGSLNITGLDEALDAAAE